MRRSYWLALLLLPILLAPDPSRANGWEHAAIPFAALLKALHFPEPETRGQAARSLGFRGQPEAVPALLERLAAPESNPHVRSALYRALGHLADARAVPALSDCLAYEARDELRADCSAALGAIADPEALPVLLEALEREEALPVRGRVVDALGSFPTEPALRALVSLLQADDPRLRHRAIAALGRSSAADAVAPLLRVLDETDDIDEQLALVEALTRLRPAAAAAPLQALLENAGDARLRTRITVALGAIRQGDSMAILIGLLDDAVPAVRFFAVRGLRELGRSEAVQPLIARSLALSRRLYESSTQELLRQPLRHLADLSLHVEILNTLTELDPVAGLPALLQAAAPYPMPRTSANALRLAEGVYQQRRAALYGLGYSRSREALARLRGATGLNDPDFRLRAVAARSLGVLGFAEAIKPLLGALTDPAAEVRWTAASVLGRLDGDRDSTLPALQERLDDDYSEVRRQAALALGYLGATAARPALERRVEDDPSQAVRVAAGLALELLER